MPDNHISIHVGFILLATSLYLGHLTFTHMGTEGMNLAYQATQVCTNIEKQQGSQNKEYNSCLKSLETLVWSLINTNNLNFKRCKADIKTESKKAWCTVWINCLPRSILITNERLVDYISRPAWNKPPIPRQEDEVTMTTTLPPPPAPPQHRKMPSTKEFLMHKLSEIGDKVSTWRESTEALYKEMDKNTERLLNEAKQNAITQFNGFRKDAEGRIASVKDDISNLKDDAHKTVKEGVKKAKKGVGDLQKQADETIGTVQSNAKSQAERVNVLANDLKERIDDTAHYAVDSVNDYGKKVSTIWGQPYPRN